MASNNDLIADIQAAAKAKGVDVPVTEGLNNVQLAETLKGLKELEAKGPSGPAGPAASKDDNDDDDVIEPAKVKRPPYYICDGKSLTTLKGILGPGDEVKVEYLIDGKDGLKRHRENGVIAKA